MIVRVSKEALYSAFGMAAHNLCVRNNIDPYDFIKTMREVREMIKQGKLEENQK